MHRKKGFVLGGTIFILLLIVVISANYLFLSGQSMSGAVIADMKIDAVYNAMVDTRRVLALDDNSAFTDALYDVADAEDCDSITVDDFSSKVKEYFTPTYNSVNAYVDYATVTSSGDPTVTLVSTSEDGDVCTFEVRVQFTYVITTDDGMVQKTDTFSSTRKVQRDDSTDEVTFV